MVVLMTVHFQNNKNTLQPFKSSAHQILPNTRFTWAVLDDTNDYDITFTSNIRNIGGVLQLSLLLKAFQMIHIAKCKNRWLRPVVPELCSKKCSLWELLQIKMFRSYPVSFTYYCNNEHLITYCFKITTTAFVIWVGLSWMILLLVSSRVAHIII